MHVECAAQCLFARYNPGGKDNENQIANTGELQNGNILREVFGDHILRSEDDRNQHHQQNTFVMSRHYVNIHKLLLCHEK